MAYAPHPSLPTASLLSTYRDGLLENTLPFWLNHACDQQHGGFFGSLDERGQVIDTDKSIWQQGRFTWLLAELANNLSPDPTWVQWAKSGADFLDTHGFDPEDGRMFFQVTRDGIPLRKRRYSFSEAFAAIAYGELAQLFNDTNYRDKALACFQTFQNHLANPPGPAKFTNARPTRGIGGAMITINIAQQLRESIKLESANAIIDQAIAEIETFHVHNDIECVVETVSPEGKRIDHFDGRTLNPGHAIEAAWFIMWEGKVRQDSRLIELGCRMLDWMWERGWDQEFGGILYFTSLDEAPIQEYWQDMKFWWPHNETIIATLLAAILTGDPKYVRWHQQVHDWSYQHFADPTNGEWFGYLRRDGAISNRLKGNLWKGPFHLPRMEWICWQMLAELPAS
ncbi:Cellobiose 2-epimerase [Roseimaritima multifibrata]|uniref:Cellobiose 2-epimerase n=1 Tax=Roseimaritima multifibrata TaxID=1930274 RepID=A0A517MLY3_9BACT|nr:AGE family epimerase/isomerase [Roseimaritima multifibrata]QDS95860.1 Cellobiose 2-epimerase [Roseimaritima multifibrata]